MVYLCPARRATSPPPCPSLTSRHPHHSFQFPEQHECFLAWGPWAGYSLCLEHLYSPSAPGRSLSFFTVQLRYTSLGIPPSSLSFHSSYCFHGTYFKLDLQIYLLDYLFNSGLQVLLAARTMSICSPSASAQCLTQHLASRCYSICICWLRMNGLDQLSRMEKGRENIDWISIRYQP